MNPAVKNKGFFREIAVNKYMYLMALPGLLWFFVFAYLPLVGIIIAFEDFHPLRGLLHSKFVGFDNFKFFFTSLDWKRVTVNTLFLNTLFIGFQIIFAVAIAVMITEINYRMFKRFTQSLVILPHFISWTVVAMFLTAFLSTDTGLINRLLMSIGLQSVSFYNTAGVWPAILVILRIWKGAGFGSVVYIATITGFDQEIYEAAKIDGASRWKCIVRITLPMLRNTVILLTLFNIGHIFYGDFGMIYAMVGDNYLLMPATDVIDTFVFRTLRMMGNMGMSAAVGLYQSVVGFILVIIANGLARHLNPESAIF